jgi:hypothetical protein
LTLTSVTASASTRGRASRPRITITSPTPGVRVDIVEAGVIGPDMAVVVGTLEFQAFATSAVGLRSCSMDTPRGTYVFVGWESTVVEMSRGGHRCDLRGNPHGWGSGTLEVTAVDLLGRTVKARQDFYHVTLVPSPPD